MRIINKDKPAPLIINTLLSSFACMFFIASQEILFLHGIFFLVLFISLASVHYLSGTDRLSTASLISLSVVFSTILGINGFTYANIYTGAFLLSVMIGAGCSLISAALMIMPYIHKLKKKDDPEEASEYISYRDYKKTCRAAWFESIESNIRNRTFKEKLFRICVMSVCAFIGFYLTIDAVKNDQFLHHFLRSIVYLSLIFFGFTFFLLGIVKSILMCAAEISVLYVSIVMSILVKAALAADADLYLLFSVSAFLLHILLLILIWIIIRWELFYSNVQVYERNSDSIAIDLFLEECKPIDRLDRLVSFEIVFSDLRELIRSLKYMLNASHLSKSILAGYYSNSNQTKIQFYMYSSDEKRLISVLAKKLQRLDIKIENIQVKEDPDWELYDSLFPTESELMPLINRTRIETLYSKGVFSNKEYSVSFYVSFKNKNDPVLFEENVVHLGLKLVFASFEEDDEENEGFSYFGEYQTDTYVTPRRIDYLCEEIQKASDDLNAFFSGDWLVNR